MSTTPIKPYSYTDPGLMVHSVTLLQPSEARDNDGEFLEPVEFATVGAAIRGLSGRALQQAQAVVPEVTHQVVIRYLPGVTAAMQLKFRERIFTIDAVTDPDELQFELILLCKERDDGE